MVEQLGIRFRQPYRAMVEFYPPDTATMAFRVRLNIVESCFQADVVATAIVEWRHGGGRRVWDVC